jgi:hypothetical protein
MTKEQIEEVREAIHEFYTLDEIYWKVSNMDWTIEMFKYFVGEITRKKKWQDARINN